MEKSVRVDRVFTQSNLHIITDTGANEKKLEEAGFPRELQRNTFKRMITLDIVNLKPSTKEEAGHGNWHEIYVKGAIVSFGVIANYENDFRLMFLASPDTICFTVVSGKKVWTFVVEGTATDVRSAVRTMFNDSLLRGPKAYDRNNVIIPNFWQKILSLVYPEPTIIEIGLRNKEQQYVPSRVYFYPEQPWNNTLSSGGYCYHLDLDVFPRESINKGTGLWSADERKKNDRSGVVNIGMLQVKPGNKEKKQQRSSATVTDIKLGNKGLGVGRAFTEETLKAALEAPEVVKPAKAKAAPAAPAKEQKKKAAK